MRWSISLRASPRQYAPDTFVSLKALPKRPVDGRCGPRHKVDELTLPVQRDVLVARYALDDLRLVVLALLLEKLDRAPTLPHLAGDGLVAVHDLAHARLYGLEVLERKRLLAGEVIVEPVLDGRPDRHLCLGVELLDRLGHHVRGIVAQQLQTLRRIARDDLDRGVLGHQAGQVVQASVDTDANGVLCQTFPNVRRDVRPAYGCFEVTC